MPALLAHARSMLALLTAALLVSACAAPGPAGVPPTPGPLSAQDALVAAARAEGTLNVIALPRDWCGYGALLDGFQQQYGVRIAVLQPDAGSGEELAAIRAHRTGPAAAAPDVVDVGLAFGPAAKQEGLLQPYKVATWASIPSAAKDVDAYWYGDYYGVLALEINTARVAHPPQEWTDLLRPEYRGQVALAGNPLSSTQAINSVYAVALAAGGSLDNARPGLDFFARLRQGGQLVPLLATQRTLADGRTPIVLRWDYNALSDQAALQGRPPITVVVPSKGVLAGIYVQGISAFAPHPHAARLWMEYLYSDAGQLGWLRGYCHPIRYNDLATRNAIPADLAARLPAADIYAHAQFPTLAQFTAAQAVITAGWNPIVGVTIK